MFFKELKELSVFKKAYIQILDGEFVNDASFYYYHGLKFLNIPIELIEDRDLGKTVIDKDTIVVAGVPATLKIFQRLGVTPPKPIDIPLELVNYCGRWVITTTIKDALDNSELQYPLFVKPAQKGKLFNGQIISCKEELEMLRYCDEEMDLETPIFISEKVKFISEFRSFVLKGQILDCRKYSGDYKKVPDFSIIENAVKDFVSSPIAYSIDFGVTEDGRTLLIECNDAYSLGPYGLNNLDLTRMFIYRWKEIVGL